MANPDVIQDGFSVPREEGRGNAYKWIGGTLATLGVIGYLGWQARNLYNDNVKVSDRKPSHPTTDTRPVDDITATKKAYVEDSDLRPDQDGWVHPDFKVNPSANLSKIEDFTHLLVEANVSKNEDLYKSEILHPDVKPTWGERLGSDLVGYKIFRITEVDSDRVPEDARIKDGKYFQLMLFTHDGDPSYYAARTFLLVKDDSRFYLAGSR